MLCNGQLTLSLVFTVYNVKCDVTVAGCLSVFSIYVNIVLLGTNYTNNWLYVFTPSVSNLVFQNVSNLNGICCFMHHFLFISILC